MAAERTNLYGRTMITTSEEEITRDNLMDVLTDAQQVHDSNASAIEYLYNYYKGDQPINTRTKEFNTDINNIVCENRAKEIVDFWTGYLMGDPIQYVGRGDADPDSVKSLNQMMVSEDKESVDVEIADWQNICGTAYRLCLPDEYFKEDDEVPFEICSIDPRQAFVIYSSGVKHEPLAGVYYTIDDDGDTHYTIYTKTRVFKADGLDEITSETTNGIGMIPLVEYPANSARLGAFEPVITMLNAINKIDSNRMDGIEQFIQALIVFTNADLDDGTTAQTIKEKGILSLRSTGDFEQKVSILAEELNQQQTQVLKDDMYQTVLTICSMPNRNGGSSTSDTGIAVVYRDGWSAAETAAKKKEMMFKKSEREFLKLAIHIANTVARKDFSFSDVDIKFTRRNYEGIQTKAQVLCEMLNNPKIDPKLAFIYSNLFADPEEAYRTSIPYIEKANLTE